MMHLKPHVHILLALKRTGCSPEVAVITVHSFYGALLLLERATKLWIFRLGDLADTFMKMK